jgi:hypothetical protein
VAGHHRVRRGSSGGLARHGARGLDDVPWCSWEPSQCSAGAAVAGHAALGRAAKTHAARCSILLEGRGVLLAGDALATFDPTTRTRGPSYFRSTPTTSRRWRRSRNWKTRARPRCCRVTAPPGAATSPRPFAGLVMPANPAASPRERSSPDDLIQPGLPAVRGKRPSAADRREAEPRPQGRRQATVYGPNGAVIRDHYKFRGPHGSPRPSASRSSPRRAGQAQGGWKRQLACVRSQRRFR